MRTIRSLIILLVVCVQVQVAWGQVSKKEIIRDNKEYREAMHKEFLDTAQTPLTAEGLADFKKLDFYPIRTKYRVVAKLTLTPDEVPFDMPRSKGNTGSYRKYGVAAFTIGKTECKLAVYQYMKLINDPAYKDDLFLPFADETNAIETYGSGRFLELKIPEGDELVIDFNKAFNPLCAYNHKYSCPIPPKENALPIEIKAGMKTYKESVHNEAK